METIDSRDNLVRLIKQYQNLVFSICLKMTGDYFTAEDITQDTFIAAFKNWKKCDEANEKTWLCRIAANKCIDYKRAAARKMIPAEDETFLAVADSVEVLHEILNKETMQEFENAVDELEEPYRNVARKYFLEGKTAKEIAFEKDVGIKTIQTWIYRARSMLKQRIRKENLIT